jgi:Peptidase family S41
VRIAALPFVALALLGAAAPSSITVSKTAIEAENARWVSLGVHLPPGGVVLQHPYRTPYSNHSFVVPWSLYERFYTVYRARHDYPVAASDLRADLPVLRLLMQKAYAGYGTAKARGWNWDAWFAQWDAQLKARGSARLTLAQAFAPWGRLEQWQLDNHSGVPSLTSFVSGSVSAVLANAPGGACSSIVGANGRTFALDTHDAGQQPHAVQSWNGSTFSTAWYVSYPRRNGSAVAIQCAAHRTALRMAVDGSTADGENAAAISGKPAYESLGDGISYVRMPTFSDANDDALTDLFSKTPNIGKERVVILDLRGNEGGNAPLTLLNTWFAESAIERAGELTQIGTQSCFRTALYFGLEQQLASTLKPPASARLSQFLQSIVDTLSTPANCEVMPDERRGDATLRDHSFTVKPAQADQTRIVAIVDNGCGSDCEYMASVLAQLPNTVIAGTSTYGVMGFAQPGYFVLPNSRVPFRLALSRTDAYGDGRSVDGYGLTVDVLLPSAQSQSRASLQALAQALE